MFLSSIITFLLLADCVVPYEDDTIIIIEENIYEENYKIT